MAYCKLDWPLWYKSAKTKTQIILTIRWYWTRVKLEKICTTGEIPDSIIIVLLSDSIIIVFTLW